MRFTGDKLQATNRFGTFVQVQTFGVRRHANEIVIDAQFSTGSICAGLAMSHRDAVRLVQAITAALPVTQPAKRGLIHATDVAYLPGQLTTTAVCGARCSVNRALRVGGWDVDSYTCVGCRAILIERQREAERARLHTDPPRS